MERSFCGFGGLTWSAAKVRTRSFGVYLTREYSLSLAVKNSQVYY
jgi:hypothetical protein